MSDPQFFVPARSFSAGEIARAVDAELTDPSLADLVITGVAPVSEGRTGHLVFAEGKKHVALLPQCRASAVICRPEAAGAVPSGIAVLAARRPQQSFARAIALLYPDAVRPGAGTGETGVSPAAHVAGDVALEDGVVVEAGAVVCAGAAIGRGTIIAANAYVGPNCRIGRDCHVGVGATVQFALIGNRVILHPGVRIGQDGFGYVAGLNEKIPQIGRVVIQDDVEIGANTAIDRGAMGDTVIGDHTKIDNLVQIGHNVRIGRACVIVSQCGISGSVTVGDHVSVGGQAGMSDHVSVGDRAMIAGRAGVTKDVPAGAEVWFGFPAQPRAAALREMAAIRSLVKPKKNAHE